MLTLTHDPFQLGLVLALAGIPRAAVMLIGGALADRHSPRVIMLVSDGLRFVIVAALAVSVLTGTVQLWMVYALALSFGVVSMVSGVWPAWSSRGPLAGPPHTCSPA